MIVYDDKEVDTGEVEIQQLTADLIHEGLKFATAGYRELCNQLERSERQPLIRQQKATEYVNKERNSLFESKFIAVLD
ncbi:hypothetical protein TNCV_182281 [Trichonephila clavipes]|nr:hypothetical protein TNCV_182281 [Trichonephila clavipes]